MYRYFLAIIVIITIVVKMSFIKSARDGHHNYLYSGATNLKQHSISFDNNRSKIVMLGNSTIAGSNIPKNNNIAYALNQSLENYKAYNLGTLGANTSSMLALFNLALKYKPKILIIALNSSLMATAQGGEIVGANLPLLKPYLELAEYLELEKDRSLKAGILGSIQGGKKVSYPPLAVINYKTWLYNLSEKIYGPTSNANFYGNKGGISYSIFKEGAVGFGVFKKIVALARANDIKLITYIDPHFGFNKEKEKMAFKDFKQELMLELSRLSITVLDYSKVLKSTSENFSDFIHLNRKGNERLADFIYRDIKEVIGD